MKVTQWFSAIKKPAYVGVYQRIWDREISYSYWNGKDWLYSADSPYQALINIQLSNTQIAKWRGIAR